MEKASLYVERLEMNVKAYLETNEDLKDQIQRFNEIVVETKEGIHVKVIENHRVLLDEMDGMKEEIDKVKLAEDKFDSRISKVQKSVMEICKKLELFKLENRNFKETMKQKYSTKESTELIEHDVRKQIQLISNEI